MDWIKKLKNWIILFIEMGIQYLGKLIKDVAKDGSEIDWNGKIVAVDANIYIHSFYHSSQGDLHNYINTWRARLEAMRTNNVRAIFVFDGTSTSAKDLEHERRNLNIQKSLAQKAINIYSEVKLEEGLTDVDFNNYYVVVEDNEVKIKCKTTESDTDDHIPKIKAIRDKIEIPTPKKEHYDSLRSILNNEFSDVVIKVINSKHEADFDLARLVREGDAYCAFSRDSDLFAHGCPRLCYDFCFGKYYELEDILRKLDFTYYMFVEFCILLGCDYNKSCESRRKYGPKTAEKRLRQYGTIDNFPIPDEHKEKLREVRDIFLKSSYNKE